MNNLNKPVALKPFKVFISYSWTTPSHEEWVINLAERLVSNGVDVVIDKWDLKEGHDKYSFMESMVNSPDIDKVLIILDSKYTEKANLREGGVGTETQIIGPAIYNKVSQEKFIPIVAERDSDGNPFLPTYLGSRIYIDLSSVEGFESNYEQLLRNIYQRPAYRKPQLGKAPNYLFEDAPSIYGTSSIVRSLETQMEKNPRRINNILSEFLNEFFDILSKFKVEFSERTHYAYGKEVYNKLNEYLPLRNDLIDFFNKLLKSNSDFNIDIIIHFLEKLPSLQYPLDNRGSWNNAEFDIFRFAIHEIFLYLIAIGLKQTNYKFVEELLHSHYYIKDKYRYDDKAETFDTFYHYIQTFDVYYKESFSKNHYSPMADFIIKRIPDGFTVAELVEADLLCHYVGRLFSASWFPILYTYKTDRRITLFNRIGSNRHFESIKGILGVKNVSELKEKLIEMKKNRDGDDIRHRNSFDPVTPIYHLIDVNAIAVTR